MAYQPLPPVGQDDMAGSLPVVIASDQSAVPVSGTVTANIGTVATLATAAKQDTGNTSLATIAGAVAGTEVQVDVLTMPTTTVQATNLDIRDLSSASDSVTAVQATAANLNMTEANSAAIKTAVEILDNAISGNEMQVDVLTMPTVTVTATNLDVQSGGADLATSTQAGAIQTAVELIDDTVKVLGTDTYTEATSKGLVMSAVRRDADTTLANTTNEFAPLQVDAAGRLKVEAFSGETLPVSLTSTTVTGTVAVTQSGTWDEVGINDSGNSLTVDAPVGTPVFVRLSDGSSAIATLPVSLAAVPSHAVTNAGTFAVQVDGSALTALQLIDDPVQVLGTDTYTEASSKGMTIGAVRRDADTTLVNTTNEFGPLQMDANGRLKVEAFSGETLPVSLASVPSHAVTNAGTFAVQVDGSALTALQLIDDTIFTDDAAFTAGTSKIQSVGFLADESSTDSVDENDIGAARMTLDRKIIVTTQPHTAGGWDSANFTTGDTFTALTNSAQVIKGSAGTFGGYYYYNPNASAAYINVYNVAAASVTVGTTTPKLTYAIPAGAAANVEISNGISFSTAMSISATTTGGGNTAPATALEVMVYYK